MPRVIRTAGVTGIALAGYRLWQRLPPSQQRWVLAEVRRNGPRIAKTAIKIAAARKGRVR